MSDIVESDEVDQDTVDKDTLAQLFNINCSLLVETEVSLKKSYINNLDGNKALNIAVSLSDNSIEIYSLHNAALSKVCKLSGHQELTQLVWCPEEDALLFSSGADGLVKMWDIRTHGFCVQEYKDAEADAPIRPYECLDINSAGRVLCAGTRLQEDEASLVFWDRRQPAPLGGYWNSHTDDITQVKFHNSKAEVLASGSMDGLINLYNILESSEDDALSFSLNLENSVESLHWSGDRLASGGQAGELALWDTLTGDKLRDWDREDICTSIKRSKADDCYTVDVFSDRRGDMVLLAGSQHDDGRSCLRSVSVTEKRLHARSDFSPNEQVVRCCWYHSQRDLLVTAGEAGLLDVWTFQQTHADIQTNHADKKTRRGRHKPY